MIVDILLPSEIARLVYGYLLEEKCTEAAKTFLNESPNLYECRSFAKYNRPIPSRVQGYTLLNMLETFCSINSIVQDQLIVFDNTHKIRQCNIVTQLKYLLEEYKSQTTDSRNERLQSVCAAVGGTPLKNHNKRHSGKDENGSNVATQSDDGYQTETPPDSLHNIPSVEATPLEHLPGYIENLQNKICETSQYMTVKTKTANKCTQSQQIKENVSQAVQTLICQASQSEKKSQEVQTSLRFLESDELLVTRLITNSIQKVQNENQESVNRLSTDSIDVKPEMNLCNNLGNYGRNQEVINLDDFGDQTSLECPKEIDLGIKDVQPKLLNGTEAHEKMDSNINQLKKDTQSQSTQGSESDNQMDIDENSSSEENISNEDVIIAEETNKSGPEVISSDSMNITPVIESVPPAQISETDNGGTSSQDTIVLDSVCNETVLAKQSIQTGLIDIPNNAAVHEKNSLNSMEPLLFDKNFPNPPELSDHNTSTPLKLYTATQNCDTNEWFSTETLPPSNIVPMKEATGSDVNGFSYTQTATENIVSPVDGFISPIISKENTKIAEKISLNCLAANVEKDDTLHTPDIPLIPKSFIQTMPPPVEPDTNVQIKNKTPDLAKNPDGENVPSNVQTSSSFGSISSLVKNTEFNRYFSIDSISVIQMDNTTNSVQNPSITPEIQVEDSVGSTGTGLSPFLKMNKKTENNVDAQKNINSTTSNKIENTQALLNVLVDEENVKASEIATKNTLDAKVDEIDGKMKDIQEVKLAINQPVQGIEAQTAIIGEKETLEVVIIDETENEINVNADIALLKDISDKGDNKIDSQAEDVLEQMLESVVGDADEISECEKGISVDVTNNIHDQAGTIKNLPTLNPAVNVTHPEPKIAVESGKKESLKSIICKTYESFIDKNKDKVASTHNSEVPTKNTPKVEEHPKTQRRSLSTPKKINSHIRALTFETPQSRSDSKINDQTRGASPETVKRNLKRIHESFQSPPVVHSHLDDQVQNNEEPLTAVNTVNEKGKLDVERTDGKLSQEKETKKENVKKSWDSDLRLLCQASDQPKVEVPKRKYKTKSREGSAKKKKRDRSKTPHKEKKSPHSKKSKKSEKEKTPRKSKKHKSSEHKDHKNKDGKDRKTKTVDELSAKDCEDLVAQIESNLFSNDKTVEKDDAKKKAELKLSAKNCRKLGAQIESNLFSNDKTVKKDDAKKKAEFKWSAKDYRDLVPLIESNLFSINKRENQNEIKKKIGDKLSAKEYKDMSALIESNLMSNKRSKVENKNKAEEKSSAKMDKDIGAKIENNLVESKDKNIKNSVKANVKSDERNILPNNENKTTNGDGKKMRNNEETNKNDEKCSGVEINRPPNKKEDVKNLNTNGDERIITVSTVQEIPISTNTIKKKDPLEYLLSDSVNDDEAFNDMLQMDSDDIMYHEELTKVNTPIEKEMAEKMLQDEEAIAAVLEEANQAINEKYKSNEAVVQQDFFPETSLMTEADESEEEEVETLKDDKKSVDKKIEEVSTVQPVKEIKKSSQDNEKLAKPEQAIDKTPDTSSKPAVDYDSIEKQLSILTDTKVASARKVVYDHVNKVEHGKVVRKKYARLKTIDTKLEKGDKLAPLSGYEVILDSSSSVRGDDSMEMPPTPQIVDPGSNSWVPNPLVREDSRTIQSSVPTPLECPPTPKIFITPQKVEEKPVEVVTQVNLQKADVVPFYHLTPITFETTKKQPKVTEFEVVKEVLKKTTPKTESEKKEEESKTNAKTTESVNLANKDESSSRMDSEDSDSSSSSDSSDSSSSSSDEDTCSMQPPVVAKAKEDIVEAKPENKLQVVIRNEEIVVGNEIIFIGREEVVTTQEPSPAKVFSIHKTDKELEETVNETPAKDENMIPEEGIFETPNVSKPVENPTNLHAKISQMMILKEQEAIKRLECQQKPKIIDNVLLSPKIDVKNYTSQVKPLLATNEQVKTMIVEKSEAEVANAIESIANQKFDEIQDAQLNLSNSSTIPLAEVKPTDKVKKRELTKAIQSIIIENKDEESSGSSSDDGSSSDGEPNLELILEDDVKSPLQELGTDALTDESLGFENNETHNTEIHVVFDEASHRRKRRTEFFSDDEMTFTPADEDGNIFTTIAPTCVDILFNLVPPKKKAGSKKEVIKVKEVIKEEEEEEIDDGDSSEDFVPVKNSRGGTKRKRTCDEPKTTKRKKNIFIY